MKRSSIILVMLAAQVMLGPIPVQGAPGDKITLPAPAGERTSGTSTAFSQVEAWLAENAPQCPPALVPEVAAGFVEQLSLRHPGELERIGTGEISLGRYESLLWQVVAARLKDPAHASAREQLVARRVGAVISQQGSADPQRAETVANRLKQESAAAYRRLAEGRMEDEEILRLPGIDVAKDASRQTQAPASAQPKVLTAQEIAGEFARRNQVGAAAAKLRAYGMTAHVTTATGAEQELQLFKLRPGNFRLHLRTPGKDTQVFAFDGVRYWRQIGAKVEEMNPEALGELRYLSEFLDPLFESEGRQFERLEDTVVDGRKCFRLRLRRGDGTGYVAVLDQENFHQVARENVDGSRIQYGDFRDFAGLTIAHSEVLSGANGQTTRLEVRRLVANCGLIAPFFAAPAAEQLDLGPLEQALAKNSAP